MNARRSDARQAVILELNLTGAGNVPALTRFQRVAREKGIKARTVFSRTKPVSGRAAVDLFLRSGSVLDLFIRQSTIRPAVKMNSFVFYKRTGLFGWRGFADLADSFGRQR
jgi:hypothetical protein